MTRVKKLIRLQINRISSLSFCMRPGGTVVAATSEPNRVVTNGMSQYSRNERNANSGIVVGINPAEDFPGHLLAGVELQEQLESRAFELGGNDYYAPAQITIDQALLPSPSRLNQSNSEDYQPVFPVVSRDS
jgi:uncharacterized protein